MKVQKIIFPTVVSLLLLWSCSSSKSTTTATGTSETTESASDTTAVQKKTESSSKEKATPNSVRGIPVNSTKKTGKGQNASEAIQKKPQ